MFRELPCVSSLRLNPNSIFVAAWFIVCALSINLLTHTTAQGVLVTVAARNQQAAGLLDGVLYDAISAQGLDSTGQVLLEGFVNDGRYGFWLGSPGALNLVAISGDSAPDATGVFLPYALGFSVPSVNASGQVVFGGATSSGESGIWTGVPGSLSRAIRAGDPAPGASGAVYAPFTHDDLHLPKYVTDSGQLVVDARLAGVGVNSSNDRGIWMGPPDGLGLVVRDGQVAPGTPAGVTFSGVSAPDFGRFANNTHVAFNANLTGPGISPTNRSSSWVGSPGTLNLIARAGDQAPGLPDGTRFSSVGITDFSASGHVALLTSLTGPGVIESNQKAIWVGQPGGLTLIAREGEQASGLPNGVLIGSIETRGVAVNSSGQVAFVADLTGTGVTEFNNASLWIGTPGSLSLLAREGDQAAGAPAGVAYGEFPSIFDRLHLTSTGEITFAMDLIGAGVSDASRTGIWVGDASSQTLIFRGSINTAYGPFANDVGQVVFTEIGNERVLLFTPVPEPWSWSLAGMVFAVIAGVSRTRPRA